MMEQLIASSAGKRGRTNAVRRAKPAPPQPVFLSAVSRSWIWEPILIEAGAVPVSLRVDASGIAHATLRSAPTRDTLLQAMRAIQQELVGVPCVLVFDMHAAIGTNALSAADLSALEDHLGLAWKRTRVAFVCPAGLEEPFVAYGMLCAGSGRFRIAFTDLKQAGDWAAIQIRIVSSAAIP